MPKPKRGPAEHHAELAQFLDHRDGRVQVDGNVELLGLRQEGPVALVVQVGVPDSWSGCSNR